MKNRNSLSRINQAALALILLSSAPAWAQSDFGYEFGQDLSANCWETGLAFAGVTALGIYSWDWGSSKTFKVNDEGWFGEDTGSGGG